MATYTIKNFSSNEVTFNKNKKHNTTVDTVTEHIITATESNEIGRNDVLFKNSVKSVNQLKPDNNFVSNQHYPFNTAVLFNYERPYLPIEDRRLTEFFTEPEFYYTVPIPEKSNIYFRSRYTKIKRTRLPEIQDANENYVRDIVAGLYLLENPIIEGVAEQSFSAQADPQLTYYYHRSMSGKCPQCEMEGFTIDGGFSIPNSGGPEGNPDGFPVSATSCAEYDFMIQEYQQTYPGGTADPITWDVTYADGSTVSGSGCADVPQPVRVASDTIWSTKGDFSAAQCAQLAIQYPTLNIQFNNYDTELVTTTVFPIGGPIGTPCSDLFATSN
jgi:hypothetical protein